MEAFGRVIAVIPALVLAVLLPFYFGKMRILEEKEATVESITEDFLESIVEKRCLSGDEWKNLCERLQKFGDYQVQCQVFSVIEEDGIYTERITNEAELFSGTVVRLVATEKRSKLENILYGSGTMLVNGRRIE